MNDALSYSTTAVMGGIGAVLVAVSLDPPAVGPLAVGLVALTVALTRVFRELLRRYPIVDTDDVEEVPRE